MGGTENSRIYELSDHAQLDEIVEYVRKSGAKKIIVETSGTRASWGLSLKSHLNDEGFDAHCRPTPLFLKRD